MPMKNKHWGVWITHDIDHIRIREHYRDLFLFRFVGVSFLELLQGKRSVIDFIRAKLLVFQPNRWDCFKEWIALEKKHRIKSTYFFAVNRGKSLSYTREEIKPVALLLKKNGFDLALHGQEYHNEEKIRQERELFKSITGFYPQGIRIHYLKKGAHSLKLFSKFHKFDSSEYSTELAQPKREEGILEIPLHIMDTYLFSPFYLNLDLEDAILYTKELFAKAKAKNNIVVFDIHPHHLDPIFPRQRKYIDWLYSHIAQDKSCKVYSSQEILGRS
ncbi:MAG: hypothetical protein V1743_02435 [Nanoarchaeota archaeon]